MLKPIDQTLVAEIELKSPDCFSIEDNDDEVLIMFSPPGKNELAKYRKELEGNKKAPETNLMYSCVLAPDVVELKKELDEDYQLSLIVLGQFRKRLYSPYKSYFIEDLEGGLFCIKNGDGVVATFKKPGKHENKKYQRQLENGSDRAHLDLMLDCISPKEDRARVTKLVDENILLQYVVVAHFIDKTMEHIKIKA